MLIVCLILLVFFHCPEEGENFELLFSSKSVELYQLFNSDDKNFLWSRCILVFLLDFIKKSAIIFRKEPPIYDIISIPS